MESYEWPLVHHRIVNDHQFSATQLQLTSRLLHFLFVLWRFGRVLCCVMLRCKDSYIQKKLSIIYYSCIKSNVDEEENYPINSALNNRMDLIYDRDSLWLMFCPQHKTNFMVSACKKPVPGSHCSIAKRALIESKFYCCVFNCARKWNRPSITRHSISRRIVLLIKSPSTLR